MPSHPLAKALLVMPQGQNTKCRALRGPTAPWREAAPLCGSWAGSLAPYRQLQSQQTLRLRVGQVGKGLVTPLFLGSTSILRDGI